MGEGLVFYAFLFGLVGHGIGCRVISRHLQYKNDRKDHKNKSSNTRCPPQVKTMHSFSVITLSGVPLCRAAPLHSIIIMVSLLSHVLTVASLLTTPQSVRIGSGVVIRKTHSCNRSGEATGEGPHETGHTPLRDSVTDELIHISYFG